MHCAVGGDQRGQQRAGLAPWEREVGQQRARPRHAEAAQAQDANRRTRPARQQHPSAFGSGAHAGIGVAQESRHNGRINDRGLARRCDQRPAGLSRSVGEQLQRVAHHLVAALRGDASGELGGPEAVGQRSREQGGGQRTLAARPQLDVVPPLRDVERLLEQPLAALVVRARRRADHARPRMRPRRLPRYGALPCRLGQFRRDGRHVHLRRRERQVGQHHRAGKGAAGASRTVSIAWATPAVSPRCAASPAIAAR